MIKAPTVAGLIRPVNAVTIERAHPATRQIPVPDFIRILRQGKAPALYLAAAIEQAEFDFFGMGRKQSEINPLPVPACAKRIRFTGQ